MFDVCIIGAGIVGSFLAYDLSHYEGSVAVIEKEHDVANQISIANSAIIHAGYDPQIGTLKGELNVLGARRYPQVCEELQVAYQKIGAFVVANEETQREQLETLRKRGEMRGIRCEIIEKAQLHEEEEHLNQNAVAALSVPDTAIITPWEVAIALMESAILNGTKLYLDEEVCAIKALTKGYQITTNKQVLCAKTIINAAGLGAEKIAEMIEGQAPFHIQVKRGEYYVLSKHAKDFVHHILYPLPSKQGKGVLCVPTIHGNLLLGPNAEEIPQVDNSTTSAGLTQVREQLEALVSQVPYQEVIRSYSGLRPCGNSNDFYIKESSTHPGIIHLGCIDSPGLASAPAISEYVIANFLMPKHTFVKKKSYQQRKKQIRCEQLSKEERNALIKQQPAYGHIICRCENISEQEIVDCIHRPCGARSIKGVKKRVRPGMGRCQGGFCEVEVAKILARELHIPLTQVLYDNEQSALGEEVKG